MLSMRDADANKYRIDYIRITYSCSTVSRNDCIVCRARECVYRCSIRAYTNFIYANNNKITLYNVLCMHTHTQTMYIFITITFRWGVFHSIRGSASDPGFLSLCFLPLPLCRRIRGAIVCKTVCKPQYRLSFIIILLRWHRIYFHFIMFIVCKSIQFMLKL